MSFSNTLGFERFPLPVGSIVAFAGNTIPYNNGMLVCNGQSLNTTTYDHLFNQIGYTYGGSGDNFNLPDLVTNPYIQGGTVSGELRPSSITLTTDVSLNVANLPSLSAGNFALGSQSYLANTNELYFSYPDSPIADQDNNYFAFTGQNILPSGKLYNTYAFQQVNTYNDTYANTYWQQNYNLLPPPPNGNGNYNPYFDSTPVAQFTITSSNSLQYTNNANPIEITAGVTLDVNPNSLQIIYLIKAWYVNPLPIAPAKLPFIPVPYNQDVSGVPIPPYFNTWN